MMDADNGKVIQSVPISAGVDANIFEPTTGMLFVSTREGMIHIFHEDSPNKLSEGRNGQDRVRGEDDANRSQDSQRFPEHVGF